MNIVEKIAAYLYSAVSGAFFLLTGYEVVNNHAFFAVLLMSLGLVMMFFSWLFLRD